MSIAFPIISWANGTNIYEVNVRQYTQEGTLKAFMKHLPRLKEMGIEILWLMPITPISVEKRQGSWGSYYAASSYIDIDPAYGTADDFSALIKQAHELGMKVIIDWVANHTGFDHMWTVKYPDWYHRDDKGNFTGLHGWVDVIDLNYTIPEMRAEMINSMKFWITEFDIDGFRCDMARTVPLDFWIEVRGECDAVKPLFWLAECEVPEYHESFDLTYGWEAMRGFEKMMKKELTLADIKIVLQNYAKYPIGSRKLLFTSNHDENTYRGTEFETFGVYSEALAAFSCTWPGVPLIYSGQEKPNKKRLEFFEKDFIDWEGEVEMAGFYKTLLDLRKKNKALQESASVLILDAHHENVLVFLCRRQRDRILVIINFAETEADFFFDHPAAVGTYQELFTGRTMQIRRKETFSLTPGQYFVYHITEAQE